MRVNGTRFVDIVWLLKILSIFYISVRQQKIFGGSLFLGFEITRKILLYSFTMKQQDKIFYCLLFVLQLINIKWNVESKRRICQLRILDLQWKKCLQHLILQKTCLRSDEIYLEAGNYKCIYNFCILLFQRVKSHILSKYRLCHFG